MSRTRKTLLALFLLAADARAFRYDSFEGGPIVWPEARAVVYYDPATFPPGYAEALERALATWSSVPGSAFRFVYGGPAPGPVAGENGLTECSFGDSVPTFAYAMTSLAAEGWRIEERDVVFNSLRYFALFPEGDPADPADFETVALHELGHAIGLRHESSRESVMDTRRPPTMPVRELKPDDEAALRFLYPGGTPGAADLRATMVGWGAGNPLSISFYAENHGPVESGPFAVSLSLGTSAFPGSEDVPLLAAEEASIPAGAGRDLAYAAPLPADLPPGRYRVRVELAPGADAALFDNRAASEEAFAFARPAAPLAPGQEASGTLGPRGLDQFAVRLPAGARVKARATLDGVVALELTPPGGGAPLARADGLLHAAIEGNFPFGGEWTIGIASGEWSRAAYDLRLSAAPLATSGAIGVGRPTELVVAGFPGGTVTVSLAPSAGMTISVTAVDPAGPVRAAGRGFRAGPLEVPESGEVRLLLSPGSGPAGLVGWSARARPGKKLPAVAR